jgi:hypothetical protein
VDSAQRLTDKTPQRQKDKVTEHLRDWLGLINACELAGDTSGAVDACREAVAFLDAYLAESVGPPPEPVSAAPPAHLLVHPARKLLQMRVAILLRLGTLLRERSKDPAAAAAALRKALDYAPSLRCSVEVLVQEGGAQAPRPVQGHFPDGDRKRIEWLQLPLKALDELAVAQEAAGRRKDALRTLDRAGLVHVAVNAGVGRADAFGMARIVRKLPPGQKLPKLTLLHVLSPGAPQMAIDLTKPEELARAYWRQAGPTAASHYFALCPEPGLEFATLDLAATYQQVQENFGGGFVCKAMLNGEEYGPLNSKPMANPVARPVGKRVVRETVNIPPGSTAVFLEALHLKGKFSVVRVEARATFRKPGDPVNPNLQYSRWMGPPGHTAVRTEFLPENLEFVRGDRKLKGTVSEFSLAPGVHPLLWRAPGRIYPIELDLTVTKGAKMGIFVNFASPFRMLQTNLTIPYVRWTAQPSMARLPDGRWVVTYGDEAGIQVSTSQNRQTWEPPRRLTPGRQCEQVRPALYVDAAGTLWLTYQSGRMAFGTEREEGLLLWITQSKDGRTWAPPRPIGLESKLALAHLMGRWWGAQGFERSKPDAAHLVQGPDGTCHLFWRGYAGMGKSFDDIRRLRKAGMARVSRSGPRTPHVTVARDGSLHAVVMVGGRVHYPTSKDGRTWNWNAELYRDPDGVVVDYPQLVHMLGRVGLIYESREGAWLRRGDLTPKPTFGPAIKLTGYVTGMSGSRLHVTPEGEASFLTCGRGAWLWRANLRDVVRVTEEF